MIIIGMDGLDPNLLEKYMEEGHLPHFSMLAKSGSFSRLGTSNPPQSPVAWSCLISGTNPGEHDVFDFVVRDPTTHLPEMGMTKEKKTGKSTLKKLFSGLTGPNIETRRKGKTFWDTLGENGIPSVILRCPVTFPAEKLVGRLLSGMGTPDIRGTQGISTLFTTEEEEKNKDSHGRIVQVKWTDSTIKSVFTGPRTQGPTGSKDLTVPFTVNRIHNNQIRVTCQEQEHTFKEGEWSPWYRLAFKSSLSKPIYGMTRLHLNSMEPFQLHATPINLDPQNPALPISYPTEYAHEIFEKIGPYYTQGMPYDTWALNENRLSEEKFLEQAYTIHEENIKTLRLELARFQSGVLFSYFGIPDLVQHMFWRYIDPQHPNPGQHKSADIRNAIQRVYICMDEVVGEVLSKMDKNTTLLVLSDHGFASFRRAVHVNSWLREQGYLVLHPGENVGKEVLSNVDWANTQAYSVGFGGIYINQFGREKDGIVYKGSETVTLKKKLSEQLKKWRDMNGRPIVKDVYDSVDLYQGPYADNGPDLFIGFNKYYRASWQTGLGAAPELLIEDNTKHWSGDHLCDPSLVPGAILSNQKIKVTNPKLIDINPTILRFFNISIDEKKSGRFLF